VSDIAPIRRRRDYFTKGESVPDDSESTSADLKLPLLDQLEEGPWPSFVKDLKQQASRRPQVAQLLQQLEESYENRWDYWRGTVLNVSGYGGGVIARYSDLGEKYPDVAQFHTIRLIEPSAFVYNTQSLRQLADASEEFGAGILQLHGMTGDILLLGFDNEKMFAAAEALMEQGWDIGGSGNGMRTIPCCVGPARCEMSCYDTLKLTSFLTKRFIGELHRPEFPYKYKFKLSGCANDCANAMTRSDMPVIGTWRDDIQVDEQAVADFVDRHGEEWVNENVTSRCPTRCIHLHGRKIEIDNHNCVRCMHCINVMHAALAPGNDRGVTLLIGGKRTVRSGEMVSTMLVPFMEMKTDADREALADLVERIWEFWGEHGHDHERVGEFIDRVGLGTFLDGVGIEPDPQMVLNPRSNPYIKFEEYTAPRLEGEPQKAANVLPREPEVTEIPFGGD